MKKQVDKMENTNNIPENKGWTLSEDMKRILRGLLFVAVILFAGYFIFKYFALRNETTKTITMLQQEIIAKDTTIFLIKGKYSKLVNTFATTLQLKNQAEANYKILSDTIKKRNEKILSITSADIKFNDKHGTTTALIPQTKGDTTFTFTSYYPDKIKYLAKFTGNVNTNTKTVGENWDFQKFQLGLILTQRKDGLWDYYIDAPEYAVVSNVKINSLPPTTYAPAAANKIFGLYGGFGIRTGINNLGGTNHLVIKGGVSFKDKFILTGDAATDKTVGLGFLIKL